MISYYTFNGSYYKLDEEKTFFQHLKNSTNEFVIVHGQIAPVIEAMHLAKVREGWQEITAEEYDVIKASIIQHISSN